MESRPEPTGISHEQYSDAMRLIQESALAEIEEWASTENWSEEETQQKYQDWLDKYWQQ